MKITEMRSSGNGKFFMAGSSDGSGSIRQSLKQYRCLWGIPENTLFSLFVVMTFFNL